ncbi:2-C-methyl-D-erythritol 4-phosphate cytidylyltransferase [Amycolatopsis sp. GM8]|uniref:IspD/TarI family cytidylyltransferase n=1 Tax=Amycolatopsis sp. GM8 TaxID=2896530 RepID=UPI001F3AA0C1|nr:2-C-methyl-D-erythritol 4-phosphate cytidylyltransferase [Amycolatopsis sp. GM8]
MKTAALVVADAVGLDALVQGESLLAHAIHGVLAAGCVDDLRIVAPARQLDSYESIVRAVPGTGNRCRVLPCGGSRAESIRLAFESLPIGFDVILLCDADRAFVPSPVIRAVAETVAGGVPAVVPVLPVTDTVKLVNSHEVIIATEDRARLRTVQTPFGCMPELLHEMCIRGIDPLAEPPAGVRTISGHQNGIRVKTPFDIAVVTALLSEEQA